MVKYKMKRILLILTIVMFVTGCIDSSVCGTYTHSDSKIILQEDGTYLYLPSHDGILQKGMYSQNGNDIQLTSAFGTATILKITKDGLIDDEGNIWRKQ